jgi:hypothetical protein
MFDMDGRLVMNKETNEGKTELQVSHLPSGIYLLKITNGEKTVMKKISISR